jgi:predicted ATPase
VGGVGKTRLALHPAADLQRSFADGVWLAEMSALRNAELLARTVSATARARHPRPKRHATPAKLIAIFFD